MNTIYILPLIAVTALIAFGLGTMVFTPTTAIMSSNEEGTTITYHAVVCKKVTRADGTIEDLGCSKNLFTHAGMNFTRNQLGGTIVGATNGTLANTSVDVIALGVRGVSTPPCGAAQNATELYMCGEFNSSVTGLTRARADAVRINDTDAPTAGNWTITKEFTASVGVDVNETGLFNGTTANQTGQDVFFAQNTFTTASLAANDKINITWFIWVT
ncbi:MAG: hypothetical protein HYW24_05285 [Candidatus Aenigmarchaeota archaeon]|nr:hypothetical protein [Candidatus Aenigmarchaeota archaeon]